MKKNTLPLLIAFVFTAATLYGQEFWEKKDYHRWSQSECQKMLQDSPWAQRFTISTVLIQSLTEEAAVPGREQNPQILYVAQLWSARPIREGLVRRAEIAQAKAKLTPEQRVALKAKQDKFVQAEFPGTIVVMLSYGSNVQSYDLDLARYWQSQSTEAMKQNTYFISRAGKISPTYVSVSQGGRHEIEFRFPREINGAPLLGPDDKELSLEFDHPQIGVLPPRRVFIRFNARKMKVRGTLVY